MSTFNNMNQADKDRNFPNMSAREKIEQRRKERAERRELQAAAALSVAEERQKGGDPRNNPKPGSALDEWRKQFKEDDGKKAKTRPTDAIQQIDNEREANLLKAQQLQSSNLTSLQNSLRMTREADDTAVKTLEQLHAQREQMVNIAEHLDSTNETLTRSERILKGMKSIGGMISNFFSKPKEHRADRSIEDMKDGTIAAQMNEEDEYEDDEQDEEVQNGKNGKERKKRLKKKKTSMDEKERQLNREVGVVKLSEGDLPKLNISSQQRSNVYTRAASNPKDAQLQELAANQQKEDEILDDITEAMRGLKTKAKEMHRELHTQTVILDHIDGRIVETDDRLKHNTGTINQILRS